MTKQEQNLSDAIDNLLTSFIDFKNTKSYGYRQSHYLNQYLQDKKRFIYVLKEFNSANSTTQNTKDCPPDTNNDCLLR